MISESVVRTLMIMAQVYGRDMNQDGALMMAHDLDGYTEPSLLEALQRCRKELKTFPSIAEIIARIEDGRPGPEEAWASIPKSEYDTCVWTDEMASAFGTTRELIEDDPIAGRKAFTEIYSKLIAQSRSKNVSVNWSATLGQDVRGRFGPIHDAVNKGRLTQKQASLLLEDVAPSGHKMIGGPVEEAVPMPEEVRKYITQVTKVIPVKEES